MKHTNWDGISGGEGEGMKFFPHPAKKNSRSHVAVHGARDGIFKVNVLRRRLGRKDTIVLTYCSSQREDKARWLAFSDDEALLVARLLLWGVQERDNLKRGIKYTKM